MIYIPNWHPEKAFQLLVRHFPSAIKTLFMLLYYFNQNYFLPIFHFQSDLACSRLIRRKLAEWLEGEKGRFTFMVKMINKLVPFQVRQYTEHIALLVPSVHLLPCTYLVLLRACNTSFLLSLWLGQSLVQYPAGRNDTLFFLAYAQRLVSVSFFLTIIGISIVPESQLLRRLSCRIKPGEKIN